MKAQDHRRRRMVDFRPLEMTREERAMKMHEETLKKWEKTGQKIATQVGRDPSTLAMNSDAQFRRVNEERFLISQVVHALSSKDSGVWTPNPRIGDLYAQREKHNLSAFETIGNPDEKEGAEGSRPTSWFESKYYKKRVKQLRGYLDKIKPFEPDFGSLLVVGKPLELKQFTYIPEPESVHEEVIAEENASQAEEFKSVVKININSNRLFFRTTPGVTQAKNIEVTNEGTSAIYYKWELAHDIDLMIGSGSNRTMLRKTSEDDMQSESFDWRLSDGFDIPKDLKPKTRSEFLFTQTSGSILPGRSTTFSFSFKSDIAGCFTQRWILRVTPNAESDSPLTVSLRGCCEVEPPDLTGFKASIDASLHESERTRCVEEILGSIYDRVSKLTHRVARVEDRIDGDVLVDDRAPIFDAANKEWGLTYSPGLFESLMAIANEAWDARGVAGFDRFWDCHITSLSASIMQIGDGATKRRLLGKLNELVRINMTPSSSGSLSYSIAYVQLSTMLDSLPDAFAHEAAVAGAELPPFVAPKAAEANEDEEQESGRRRHKGKREQRKAPAKKPKKGSKEEEAQRLLASQQSQRSIAGAEIAPELRAAMLAAVKELLKQRMQTFEQLAGESRGVAAQLTRVNEVDRLDTNLDAEVEDDL